MNQLARILPAPRRALLTDDPEAILDFALYSSTRGQTALATLTEIRGGASRSLGAQVVIAADGGFAGYVSGGCVEAAVAFEALLAMSANADRKILFGAGSPFIDIALPCGGGITVSIHLLREPDVLRTCLRRLSNREASGLRYDGIHKTMTFIDTPPNSFTLEQDGFVVAFQPKTRIVISGNSLEASIVERLAVASGYDVVVVADRARIADVEKHIDPYTAVVSLHHDLDAEDNLLDKALRSPAFYIGALGSTRTHQARSKRLEQRSHSEASIKRIRAPIGLFGPARDANTLALSVLAEVASERLRIEV